MHPPVAALLLASLLLLCRFAAAGAPVVLETNPVIGARAVDPALERITVRFSEPMRDGSWSWCGGGPTYPEITAPPRFIDPQTAELPVRLEPGRTYHIGINCPAAQNFRSALGEPSEPTRLVFTTGWTEEDLIVSDSANQASLAGLRDIILHRYSHADRSGTDWEAAFEDAREWLLASPDHREFILRAGILLSPAGDPHLRLVDPELGTVSTHHRYPVLNRDDEAVAAMVSDLVIHSHNVRSGRIDGFGYLAIDSWSLDTSEEETVHRVLGRLAGETTGLVLDVRGNGGGIEDQALRVASWFHTESAVYARHRFRDPGAPGGWTEMRTRVVRPGGRDRHFPHPVAVLQGPVCLSSNEAFLMMMDAAPRATRFGAASGGSSGNPGRETLANGIDVVFARWQSFTPNGDSFEGVGIAPDVAVDWTPGGHDEVLARAVGDLRLQQVLSTP